MKKDIAETTMKEIIAEVDRDFWQQHPEFKGRRLGRAPEDEQARKAWNDLFARRAFQIVGSIRDRDEAERLVVGDR